MSVCHEQPCCMHEGQAIDVISGSKDFKNRETFRCH